MVCKTIDIGSNPVLASMVNLVLFVGSVFVFTLILLGVCRWAISFGRFRIDEIWMTQFRGGYGFGEQFFLSDEKHGEIYSHDIKWRADENDLEEMKKDNFSWLLDKYNPHK